MKLIESINVAQSFFTCALHFDECDEYDRICGIQ